MSGLGPSLAYRLVRMVIGLWSVVTAVFIVMWLSGWRHPERERQAVGVPLRISGMRLTFPHRGREQPGV